MMRLRDIVLAAIAGLSVATAAHAAPPPTAPRPIRAVVLVTYEAGADRGDAPGELQPWVEGEHLTETLPFPFGLHPIYTDQAHHLLVVLTGTTTAPAAASVMALGTDPRFDLSHAYWLMDGISGFDPDAASLGSVVWANWVVGDIMRGIDPREAPKQWPYGFFMEGAARPNQYQPPDPSGGVFHTLAFPLNPGLARWAFEQTRSITLENTPRLQAARGLWRDHPATQEPPTVLIGGDFAADTFWHGRIMTRFAEDWVKLATQGRSRFVTSNMEDAGALESLSRLAHAGRADMARVMVLRSNSNYTEQHDGQTAEQSLNGPFAADTEALANGYRVGAAVIHKLMDGWATYGTQVP